MRPRDRRCRLLKLLAFTLAAGGLLPAASAGESAGPDWPRLQRLLERERTGTLSSQESEELYAALARVDPRRHPEQATRLALAGMTGDGGSASVRVPPVVTPECASPVRTLVATAADGRRVEASWRLPATCEGTFPTLVFLHGGLEEMPADRRRVQVLRNPAITRLLDAGFAVVQATFRDYSPNNLQDEGPALGAVTVFEAVRGLESIDPARVALFGGSLAFEVAARPKPRAVIAGEPATILLAGMLTTSDYRPRVEMTRDPAAHFGEPQRQLLQRKLAAITCPALILHGDIHPPKLMNHEIFIPALREHGITTEVKIYPAQGHGFYFGSGTSPTAVEQGVQDVRDFLNRHPPAAQP